MLHSPPRFSVIVPAFNEERYLPRLLDSLDAARRAYGGGRDAVEVIVADNASTDGTAPVALARGCRVAPVPRRAIASARNGGARAANGSVLAFVDADTVRVHPRTFDAVDQALATGRYVGGATGVGLERWSAGIAVTFALMVPLVWITGMDTGVVFCRREDFEAVGGYDERRYFAEDVAFLAALRRLGRPRGQRLARLTDVKAVASTRKFDDHGDWHYLSWMPRALLAMLRDPTGKGPAVERYWYRPGR
jgi:glycosyltransferase involved in cell wall biosynthesis